MADIIVNFEFKESEFALILASVWRDLLSCLKSDKGLSVLQPLLSCLPVVVVVLAVGGQGGGGGGDGADDMTADHVSRQRCVCSNEG